MEMEFTRQEVMLLRDAITYYRSMAREEGYPVLEHCCSSLESRIRNSLLDTALPEDERCVDEDHAYLHIVF